MNTSNVNFNVCVELTFGTPFDPLPNDRATADKLVAGELTLAPHPSWRMPRQLHWGENPFGEINWVAQYHMMRWIDPLRRTFVATGDQSYMVRWLELAESWIDANPPGRGKAAYSWADMVEAGRAMTFAFGLPQLQQAGLSGVDKVSESLAQHGDWLADPSKIRTGNHALQQHQGLLVIGAALGRNDWVDLAIQRSSQMLLTAYDEEGINEEGALQYHQINYTWWNQLRRRIEIVRGSAPSEFGRIERATDGLLHSLRPDGAYELIGDTEIFRPRLDLTPELKYATTGGAEGRQPRETLKVFSAGYIFGRSGWGDESRPMSGESFYSVRFGPQNRIHGHVDGTSLTLFCRGESILADTGKYAYDHKDPVRAFVAGRSGHNSVELEGVEYDRESVVTLESNDSRRTLQLFVLKDIGYDEHKLIRTLLIDLEMGFVVVIDHVEGPLKARAKQNWHLGKTFSHRKESSNVLAKSAANRVWISPSDVSYPMSVVAGKTAPVQGWLSESWRQKVKSRVVEISSSEVNSYIATLVDFSGTETPPSISVHFSERDQMMTVTITRNLAVYLIVLRNGRIDSYIHL